jgi:putative ABC transport system permease protein
VRGDSEAILERNGVPTVLRGLRVSYDFFDTLGVRVAIGRTFTRDEELPEHDRVMILTHEGWKRHFPGDPNPVGRAFYSSIHGYSIRVIGVLPEGFRPLRMSNPGESPEYFFPLGKDISREVPTGGGNVAIARLKPGVSVAQAQAELNVKMRRLIEQYPRSYARNTVITLTPLREQLVGRISTALWILWGAAGLTLLIACTNLANLFLARAAARSQEIALRAALGGGRWRLVRQMLTESVLVALAGGAAGALAAWAGIAAIRAGAPRQLARMEEIRMDPSILWFSLAVSIGTGLLFGLVPALRASRVDLTEALKGTAGAHGRRHGLRKLLVIAELATAFVLVAGTALLSKSFLRLMSLNPGYDPRHVLTCTVECYGSRYATYQQHLDYFRQVREKVRSLAGVESVGMANTVPLSQTTENHLTIREKPLINPAETPIIDSYVVTPDYFGTLRIPLKRGRLFRDEDGPNSPRVALVSESCARRLFPPGDPLGMHVMLDTGDENPSWATVVGIVGDVRQHGLDSRGDMGVYIPQAQQDSWVRMAVRTRGDPAALIPAVRAAIHELDATQAVWHFQTMDDWVAASLAERRFTLGLIALFGGLALVLAIVGVYGVISYMASLRTREVGIRMALGAQPRSIVAMMLRDVSAMLVWGLAAGLTGALALTQVLAHLLYQVPPRDPETLATVTLVLALTALAAGYLPARRAAAIDPNRALRCE